MHAADNRSLDQFGFHILDSVILQSWKIQYEQPPLPFDSSTSWLVVKHISLSEA